MKRRITRRITRRAEHSRFLISFASYPTRDILSTHRFVKEDQVILIRAAPTRFLISVYWPYQLSGKHVDERWDGVVVQYRLCDHIITLFLSTCASF